jgi:hypothetical protein
MNTKPIIEHLDAIAKRAEAATAGPWVSHERYKCTVVPLADAAKYIGCSNDPEREAERFAKVLHQEEGTEFTEYHKSRLLPIEAQSNTDFIAHSRDDVPRLVEALRAASELLADFSTGLSGPYKQDPLAHAAEVISATEQKAAEALARIGEILNGRAR